MEIDGRQRGAAPARDRARLSAAAILLVLVWAIFAATQPPRALVLGMNADGIEYGALSRNLAAR